MKTSYIFLIINHNITLNTVKVTTVGTREVSSEKKMVCSEIPRVGANLYPPIPPRPHPFHYCRYCCRKNMLEEGVGLRETESVKDVTERRELK